MAASSLLLADTTLFIPVRTKKTSIPLALSYPKNQELTEVLRFDLAASGHLAEDPSASTRVEVREEGNELFAFVRFPTGREWMSRRYSPADRRACHRLVDELVSSIAEEEGIASKRMLFSLSATEGWSSAIWETDYDGFYATRLTSDQVGYCVTPRYIPGGERRQILFVAYRGKQPKIYFTDTKGKIRPLLQEEGNQLLPALSPQGNRVAFISDAAGRADLYVVDFSPDLGALGKASRIASLSGVVHGSPVFSPDGKRLAFVSDKTGGPRIYVGRVQKEQGGYHLLGAHSINYRARGASAPAWSPDGRNIAFCAPVEGVRQIWIHDLEKEEERAVTTGPGHKENPAWAAGGQHLFYDAPVRGERQLFLLPLPTARPVQITSGSGDRRFVSIGESIK